MNIVESFKMAIDSIFANKMRSFLTMLGIIIGIASVIAILSVGNGATSEITGTFNDLGASTISVSVSNDATPSQKVTKQDMTAIKNSNSKIERVSSDVQLAGTAIANNIEKEALISGGTPDLQFTNQMMDSSIVAGRFFNQAEYDESANVAVISEDAAKAFFNGQTDVVGKTVRLSARQGQNTVRVVGVTKGTFSKMKGSFDTSKMPAYLAMPQTTMVSLTPTAATVSSLTLKVASKDDITSISKEVVQLLEIRHDALGEKIYTAQNYLQALDQVDSVLGLFINFIAAVAAIALLVGGIGVMNIMLVSVTERTREIGTRKALGATTSNILVQFLMESIILSLIGGVIGLVLGILLANIVAGALSITAHVTIGAVLLVLLFSTAVGVFFGIYPAKKAARLDPIEALRYE